MGTHLLVVALGGTLGLGLYHGYRGGLIRSAFKLVGLAAGILLARPVATWIHPEIVDFMDFPGSWPLLVLLSFVAITVLFALAGWLMSLLIRWTPLVWIDRVGGAGLGFVMGLLVCAVILGLLDHLAILEELTREATGWEKSFLDWVQAVAPDLFEQLKGLVRPTRVPGGTA